MAAVIETTCNHCGRTFARENARGGTFDGTVARYRCPACTRWTRGPPP